jgi:hypothetical protein
VTSPDVTAGTRGVPFSQYLLPDGRRRSVWIERSVEVESLARELVERGVHFDVEALRTGDVSLTAELDEDDERVLRLGTPVLAIETCANGPAVPDAVDRLVRTAHARLTEGADHGDA